MAIAWDSFTPVPALLGGGLIGLSAGWLILANGRIAGISGIVGGLIERAADWPERLAFVLGLLIAPALVWLASARPVSAELAVSPPLLIVAGLLVGFGSRLGSGCTSGHGVCGLARRSPRSLAATAGFMATGFATVYLLRHGLA